ncbi:hypothetical protein PUN28_015500 [Cardiocondyla obscurior]|uniref:Uncharacterized protein n=1 Tax=Cardiocondyla obscurior TaxID=286306 RepID=A0AAW2EUJ0_9HYME
MLLPLSRTARWLLFVRSSNLSYISFFILFYFILFFLCTLSTTAAITIPIYEKFFSTYVLLRIDYYHLFNIKI